VKKNNIILVVLFGVLSAALLLYFIKSSSSEKRYSWRENYQSGSDQPYGTKFILELLKSYRPEGTFVYNDKKPLHQLLDSMQITDSTDYIFIGEQLYLDDTDRDALLKFIESGNDAFITSLHLPFEVLDRVFVNECGRDMFLESQDTTAVTLNFYHGSVRSAKGYRYAYHRGAVELPYYWDYFNPLLFCDSVKTMVPLGYQVPGRVNFIRFTYGKGNLYIHTNPIVFTNYFLSDTEKATYAGQVFSQLHGQSIIWDEYSKVPFQGSRERYNSPLSYFLQHTSLKYAWWMMLFTVILYTFFTAKRKQRAIPVLQEKTNTSLEFVKMISALHFQNANHLDIAQKKMKYFLYFIRAKYGIHAQPFTEAHIRRLSEKSKVEATDIKLIFDEFARIERDPYRTPGPDLLVRLYSLLDNFYKHCK